MRLPGPHIVGVYLSNPELAGFGIETEGGGGWKLKTLAGVCIGIQEDQYVCPSVYLSWNSVDTIGQVVTKTGRKAS